jgi:hypothetical protein
MKTKKPIEIVFKNIRQLAGHVADAERGDKVEIMCKRIARRVYKDTSCGISFYHPPRTNVVILTGYCEGTDAECPAHELTFPFTDKEWNETVELADKDGCELWDETHGCEDCGEEDVFGNRPINPECKSCNGLGNVI